MVVPVLAFEDVGPIEALKRSSSILRQRFGTVARGGLRFGFLFSASHSSPSPYWPSGSWPPSPASPRRVPIAVLGFAALLGVGMYAAAAGMYMRTILYRFATDKPIPTSASTSPRCSAPGSQARAGRSAGDAHSGPGQTTRPGRGRSSYHCSMGVARHAGFDHVTLAVEDLDGAVGFFGLLDFVETKRVVVSGPAMSAYMGIEDWEADHVTLELRGAPTHQEVQLLRFHRPTPRPDPHEADLARLGFNHVCFAVDDLDATLDRLRAAGVHVRNDVLEFHDRRLVFVRGPGTSPSSWRSGRATPPEDGVGVTAGGLEFRR